VTRLNLVRKNFAPLPPLNCEMCDFDVQMVPFYLGALWLRAQKYWWVDQENAARARSYLNEQMVRFLMPCGADIVAATDRVYRLLDSTLNGRFWDWTGSGTPEDPYVITPEIPIVPDPEYYEYNSMHNDLNSLMLYVRNLVTGSPNVLVSDTRNIRQQFDDILAAIEAGGSFNDDEIISKLEAIILALGV